MIIVVFGVAGVGKTTVGRLLAENFGWKFYDADDFHPAANVDKMRKGQALTDHDRQPWLQHLRELIDSVLAQNKNAVLACSALKKKYRDQLRVGADVKFVFLRASRKRVEHQLKNRRGHYFEPTLLGSQFADLEEPIPTEDAITVQLTGEPRDVVTKIVSSLRGLLR